MITDLAIDQALIELKRTEYHLLALRSERRKIKEAELSQMHAAPARSGEFTEAEIAKAISAPYVNPYRKLGKFHAAAKRASLDLTRKLADLRAGR